MNHKRTLSVGIFLVCFAILASTTMADDPGKSPDKPLILELQFQSGTDVMRQSTFVYEGRPFQVVTREGNYRWVVEGDIQRIAGGVAIVSLKVGWHGPDDTGVYFRDPMELQLKIDEFNGGGFGTNHLGISDLWIRRGDDAIPILIEQLSADPKRSVAAAYYLGELGSEAESAIAGLEKAALSENEQVKHAAVQSLNEINESIRKEKRK